jgi:hypothetical protein
MIDKEKQKKKRKRKEKKKRMFSEQSTTARFELALPKEMPH